MKSISVKHALSLSVVLVAVWLGWSGIYQPLLLSFGVASILISVYVTASLESLDNEGQPIQWTVKMFWYLPWLLKEIIVANIDVMKRVVNPSLSQPEANVISPTWVKVAASQQSRLGLTLFANSITLTPGTVSVDSGDGYIWVHALSKEGAESLLGDDGGEMGRMASKMEAE